jgi:predicted transcriptional regulator
MELDNFARYWRYRLFSGKPVYRVRVRRLLELVDAERRGWAITRRIASTLEQYGLRTDPDFQDAWIDGLVAIRLIAGGETENTGGGTGDNESETQLETGPNGALADHIEDGPGAEQTLPAVEIAPVAEVLSVPMGDVGLVEVPVSSSPDPIIRISSIPSANRGVMSVLLTDDIEKATTLMSFEGYSQLAIMQGAREVRGMITWESIARRSMLAPEPETVADCRTDAHVIDSDAGLFDALPTIERYGYVLVRSKERTITGIITASDFAVELGEHSYAFMCLKTIEMLIRKKLHPCLGAADLLDLEEHSKARKESDPAQLTFGENVRLLERDAIWARLRVNIDKTEFVKRLLETRDIRNDIMHFSPDPLGQKQKRSLKQMEDFLRQVFV